MAPWTSDELRRIDAADELQITPLRQDGTLRTPVPIWVVRHGDDLYVHSYKGRGASWFHATQAHHEGQFHSGGVDKDVIFVEESDPDTNDWIDTAYRTKYRR